MSIACFLIIFPLVLGLLLFAAINSRICNFLVKLGAVGIFGATAVLLVTSFHRQTVYLEIPTILVDKAMFVVELLIAGFLCYLCVRAKQFLACALVVIQVVLKIGFEALIAHQEIVTRAMFVDKLSILMALVVGGIGSFICIYATGYMKDFHESFHQEIRDRRNIFFALIFIFFSAMFGVIFSNNLLWLYFFWEITTLCSFLLIGYKATEQARKNAFHALTMNLIGGLAFVLGIIYLYFNAHILELDKIFTMSKALVLLPVVLISIAGLAKSAQYPFSSWLLGAMIAPTPISALLHSSTMVKAGVYIILRFASVFEGTMAGFVLAIIGGVTFTIASFAAMSQSDAKKILAYSTIANLGLIVLCCGVGTYEAAWAAMLLILFHAVAKCLLFLCVGVVEHKLHSRNTEDMMGLIISMPKVSIMIQVGIAGMFLAPFGMLISKWAALKAIVDFNPSLLVFIVFGGAATLFFWVKWLGTLIMVSGTLKDVEETTSNSEWFALGALSIGTVGMCAFFPAVSSFLIQPYVIEVYGRSMVMSHGNLLIMSIMLAMVMLFPLSFFNYGKKVKVVDAYMAGANVDNSSCFHGSAGMKYEMELKGYYLDKYFQEDRLRKIGVAVCALLIAILVGITLL